MQRVIELVPQDLICARALEQLTGGRPRSGLRELATAFCFEGLRFRLQGAELVLKPCRGGVMPPLFPILFELAHVPLLLRRVRRCRISLDHGRRGHALVCEALGSAVDVGSEAGARLWLTGTCMNCSGCRASRSRTETEGSFPIDPERGSELDVESLGSASENLMLRLLHDVTEGLEKTRRKWEVLIRIPRTAPEAAIHCARVARDGAWEVACPPNPPRPAPRSHRQAFLPGRGDAARLGAALRTALHGPLVELVYSLSIGAGLVWRKARQFICLALRRLVWLRIELSRDEPWQEPLQEAMMIEEIGGRLWRVTHWQESGAHFMAYARRLELIHSYGGPSADRANDTRTI